MNNNIDLEAEQEGTALKKSKEFSIKKATKKQKTKTVNTKTLDKTFLDHYGSSGYVARGEK